MDKEDSKKCIEEINRQKVILQGYEDIRETVYEKLGHGGRGYVVDMIDIKQKIGWCRSKIDLLQRLEKDGWELADMEYPDIHIETDGSDGATYCWLGNDKYISSGGSLRTSKGEVIQHNQYIFVTWKQKTLVIGDKMIECNVVRDFMELRLAESVYTILYGATKDVFYLIHYEIVVKARHLPLTTESVYVLQHNLEIPEEQTTAEVPKKKSFLHFWR